MGQDKRIGNFKILICVCMYNEGGSAINLTLNGIYNNLKLFDQAGIHPNDIAVVLLQDGILKLMENPTKRIYKQGQDSMIEFYKALDKLEGKDVCEL